MGSLSQTARAIYFHICSSSYNKCKNKSTEPIVDMVLKLSLKVKTIHI